MLSILFLFYNANVLKKLKRSKFKITSINFVDDINILTYENNTMNNCKILKKKTHDICDEWMTRHEIHFVLTKFQLIHLTRNDKKFDMIKNIWINDVVKTLIFYIQIVDLQINSKLKWDFHLKHIQKKINTQILIFSKLIALV